MLVDLGVMYDVCKKLFPFHSVVFYLKYKTLVLTFLWFSFLVPDLRCGRLSHLIHNMEMRRSEERRQSFFSSSSTSSTGVSSWRFCRPSDVPFNVYLGFDWHLKEQSLTFNRLLSKDLSFLGATRVFMYKFRRIWFLTLVFKIWSY